MEKRKDRQAPRQGTVYIHCVAGLGEPHFHKLRGHESHSRFPQACWLPYTMAWSEGCEVQKDALGRIALWLGDQSHRDDQMVRCRMEKGCASIRVQCRDNVNMLLTHSRFRFQQFMLQKCSPSTRLLKDAHRCDL